MVWIYIVLAGFLEIVWVMGLKYSKGFTEVIPSILTVGLILFSFFLLSKAFHSISLGTGYAIFTGIGTVGTIVTGMVFLEEAINPLKILFVSLILFGIIGLKINSTKS